MSWQDFEDYEAEIRMILPDLPHAPYVSIPIVEGYKTGLTPEQVADKLFANSPCDFKSVSQVVTLKFDTEAEAKEFSEVMQDISRSAKDRAIRHIIESKEGERLKFLTEQEVNNMPVGTRVYVKWSGGNGPYWYQIGQDRWGNKTINIESDGTFVAFVSDAGIGLMKQSTRVQVEI